MQSILVRAALSGAALSLFTLAACAPPTSRQTAPQERPPVDAASARAAGLLALDALAPVWGGAAQGGDDCVERYAAAPLFERCLKLKTDPAALSTDMPRLDALAAAAGADALSAADTEWLRAMDAVFDPLAGRAPGGAVFAAAERRMAQLLARDTPAFGASSLAEVMDPAGAPLSPAEAALLASRIARAEAARASWAREASKARATQAALADYATLLSAFQSGLKEQP